MAGEQSPGILDCLRGGIGVVVTQQQWAVRGCSRAHICIVTPDAARDHGAKHPSEEGYSRRLEALGGKFDAQLAAGVVQGLVQRAARRAPPFGEHVDRDVVQCYGRKYLALLWR